MLSLSDRWHSLWSKLQGSPTFVPTRLADLPVIGAVDANSQDAFAPNQHYFQIRVNELFLVNGRDWFTTYDPLVFTVAEVQYDKNVESVPFVIGPSLIQKKVPQVPQGILLTNTRVAGLYPYRGGKLTLTVVLCKVRRENYLSKLLEMTESAAAALDFSTAVSSYVKVGKVIMQGVEALCGSTADTIPLVGLRTEIDPDAGEKIKPGYHALINAKQGDAPAGQFWVKGDQLCKGTTSDNAEPYRAADYVLFQVARSNLRSDVSTLPFYALYERVIEEAAQPGAESWKRAKANMLALYQALVLSPDVTPGHRDQLIAEYLKEMEKLHGVAGTIQDMGAAARDSGTRAALADAVKVLDL